MLKELAAAAASPLRAPELRAPRAFHVRCSKPHELLELGAERFSERASGSGSTAVAGAQVASTPSVSRAVFLSHTSRCHTMRKWPTPTTATGPTCNERASGDAAQSASTPMQPQMAQKPVLRGEAGARALRVRPLSRGAQWLASFILCGHQVVPATDAAWAICSRPSSFSLSPPQALRTALSLSSSSRGDLFTVVGFDVRGHTASP